MLMPVYSLEIFKNDLNIIKYIIYNIADYVAHKNDINIVISVDEYKIRYVDSKADASELRCICQSKLYYRKNS